MINFIVEGNNFKNPDDVSVGYCKIPSYSSTSNGVGELNKKNKKENNLIHLLISNHDSR